MKIILLILTLFVASCATTPTTVAYKTEAVTITTVDAAMSAWADYVRFNPETPQSQRDAVHVAYNDYFKAQQAIAATVAAGQEPSIANIVATEQRLISIVQLFMKGK